MKESPDKPPSRRGPLSRLFDGETTPEEARREINEGPRLQRYRTALVAVIAKLTKLATRLKAQEGGSCALGVVLRVDEADVSVTNGKPFEVATPVEILRCATRPELVGKTGFVLAEPDDAGVIEVSFEDGSIESFSADEKDPDIKVLVAHGRRVAVSYDGRVSDCALPDGLVVRVGDTVRVNRTTGAVYAVVAELPTWEIATVEQVFENATCRVEFRNSTRVVSSGASAGTLDIGHRVGLDSSGSIVLRDFGLEDGRFQLLEDTGVTFDDIGGHEKAKEMIYDAVIRPVEDGELYAYYGKRPARGAILFGAPGCGKTEITKAAATMLAEIHRRRFPGTKIPVGYLAVNASEILEHLVGKAEKTVRSWEEWGKKFYKRHGYRPIISIDEAESVFRKRGTGISSDATDTIVTALLGVMGGMRDPGAFFILSTNRPDILDPALMRDGRIDRKIEIGRPDQKAGEIIFGIHLRKTRVAEGVNREALAAAAAAALYHSRYAYYEIAQPAKEGETSAPEPIHLTLGDITSGAMIAGIVQRSIDFAITRDKASGTKTGITEADLLQAVDEKFLENMNVNHDDDLRELFDKRHIERGKVQKLRQARAA